MKTISLLTAVTAAMVINTSATEIRDFVYDFVPNTALTTRADDQFDFSHGRFYTWNIQLGALANETITGAKIEFFQINNINIEPNALYVNLLDDDAAPTGVTPTRMQTGTTTTASQYADGTGTGNDLAGWSSSQLLGTYVDHFNPVTFTRADGSTYTRMANNAENFTMEFNQANIDLLNQYLQNGQDFALGFDSDCHYLETGIKLTLLTSPKPSPQVPDGGSTLALLGGALLAMGGLRRMKH